ncbi:23S rRNA (pseudouridine(1915)-N(3))-methyltransferase RlmH [Mycoplasma anatis]|uniref:23S rRNA (pseudouridine(1915)-N(3))-methyltransferase RlmH n=1 Tax=Mycoplasmopsis anatis TaxID=171279 RepID=UPI001C4DF881|nr:23S rRNA (pseudouridine(1915)-N(3))-methyltransferase RlmH [Mycoplasmopsis anatis]MBW0599318.1 23S rRNA (pseudouridine(1915)-N(3))-methyltransferase RlmH [Mycoplasmopsis anatis]MBW0603240.1 23S rRNA (pseudouridine(1915)-N(3))-methyltransferase RlmH [Mycoplasmopsis anatis]
MKINIIAVGTLEKDFKILYSEYIRKVNSYAKVNLIEIKESKENNIEVKKAKETELIQSKIPKNSPVVLCSLQGKMYDSIEFSEIFNKDNITFIIGGSDGVVEEKFENVTKIKFSNMTFPHQLFRVMLSEQIYRAFSIINNKKYHK